MGKPKEVLESSGESLKEFLGQIYMVDKADLNSSMRRWSSGRIVPCHGTDPGSIPGRRNDMG